MEIIGIDIGTTSICGVLIDAYSGELLKKRTISSEAFIETDNDFEKIQDPKKIISLSLGILNEFISDKTGAIGVTGQMHGIVYLDKEGKAVSPLYTWQDTRGNLPYKNTTYSAFLGVPAGYGLVSDFYNRENGLVPKNAVSFSTIHDYFVMTLTGLKKPLIHTSDAASFGLFGLSTNTFNAPVNADITSGFTVAGKYKGIPVSVAIGDNQASVFSTLQSDDDLLINVGTGAQVSLISDCEIKAPNIETRPYFDNKYLIVGCSLCGGRAYSILKNFYKETFSFIKDLSDEETYDIMEKMLQKEGALKVDTRFAGTRENPSIKGSITDISTENFNPQSLTRGVLAGMVSELYDLYENMNKQTKGLVGSGNGVRKNKSFIALSKEKFQKDLKIPAHLEEAAFGAAMFAAVASGIFCSSDEAKKLIKYNEVV